MKENEVGTLVLAAAIEVHRELGPGLLESVYGIVLARELFSRGLAVERQVPVPIEQSNGVASKSKAMGSRLNI